MPSLSTRGTGGRHGLGRRGGHGGMGARDGPVAIVTEVTLHKNPASLFLVSFSVSLEPEHFRDFIGAFKHFLKTCKNSCGISI